MNDSAPVPFTATRLQKDVEAYRQSADYDFQWPSRAEIERRLEAAFVEWTANG